MRVSEYATDIADVFPDKKVTLLHSRQQLLPRFSQAMHNESECFQLSSRTLVCLTNRVCSPVDASKNEHHDHSRRTPRYPLSSIGRNSHRRRWEDRARRPHARRARDTCRACGMPSAYSLTTLAKGCAYPAAVYGSEAQYRVDGAGCPRRRQL